jgi:hypothetical protein
VAVPATTAVRATPRMSPGMVMFLLWLDQRSVASRAATMAS